MKIRRRPLSQETKDRIAESMKNRPRKPERGRLISEGMQRGKATREEVKREKELKKRKEQLHQKLDSMTRKQEAERWRRLRERYERYGTDSETPLWIQNLEKELRKAEEEGKEVSFQRAYEIAARSTRKEYLITLEKRLARFLERRNLKRELTKAEKKGEVISLQRAYEIAAQSTRRKSLSIKDTKRVARFVERWNRNVEYKKHLAAMEATRKAYWETQPKPEAKPESDWSSEPFVRTAPSKPILPITYYDPDDPRLKR